MNEATADRIKNNPFYKPSPKQQAEINELDKNSTIAFGKPPIHNVNIPTHPVLKRRKQNERNR